MKEKDLLLGLEFSNPICFENMNDVEYKRYIIE